MRLTAMRLTAMRLTAMRLTAMRLTGRTEPNLAEKEPTRRERTGRAPAGRDRPTPGRADRDRSPPRNVPVTGGRSAGAAPMAQRAVTARPGTSPGHRRASALRTDPREPRGD